MTVDELGHLPAGYYYLRSGDPRHLGSNPPLANVISAAPHQTYKESLVVRTMLPRDGHVQARIGPVSSKRAAGRASRIWP